MNQNGPSLDIPSHHEQLKNFSFLFKVTTSKFFFLAFLRLTKRKVIFLFLNLMNNQFFVTSFLSFAHLNNEVLSRLQKTWINLGSKSWTCDADDTGLTVYFSLPGISCFWSLSLVHHIFPKCMSCFLTKWFSRPLFLYLFLKTLISVLLSWYGTFFLSTALLWRWLLVLLFLSVSLFCTWL